MASGKKSQTEPVELSSARSKKLGLSEPVQAALDGIQAELADAYREGFTEMVRAIQEQASALNRIQNTLNLLLSALAPTLVDRAPPAIRIAEFGENPDLASAVVVADPIGQGYTMSQTSLAKAMGVSPSDLGIALKALKLNGKAEFAVVVRTGKQSIVNYHPRAVQAFATVIKSTPTSSLEGNERSALKRLKKRLSEQNG